MPILQLALDSETLTEAQLFDYGLNFIRTQLATVQGAAVPLPYGGKPREIMVDLDPDALFAKGLSATDVSNALNQQNLILPAGTAKIAEREYYVRLNSSPEVAEALNDFPIKQVERRHRLHARRGPGARRLRRAEQHRAPERAPLGAADDPQDRHGLDARHRRPGPQRPCRGSRPRCRRS